MQEAHPSLCDHLVGGDGVGGEREAREAGDICILWLVRVVM